MKQVFIRCALAFLSLFILSAYSCGGSAASSGFKIHIEEIISDELGVTPLGGIGGVEVAANWINDLPNRTITGTVTHLDDVTDGSGNLVIANARVPAVWETTWSDQGHCSNQGVFGDRNEIEDGDTIAYICLTLSAPFFDASPEVVDETSLPTMTLHSLVSNIDTTYGTPLVDFRDVGGNLLGTATVSWVSADHTQLSVSPWPLAGVYDGSYSAVTRVYNSDGSMRYVGASRFVTSGNPKPDALPPPPDGGCGGTGGIANSCN